MRVVATREGALATGRHLPGRGAWLCAATTSACLAKALRRGGLARALRRQLRPEAVEALEASLAS